LPESIASSVSQFVFKMLPGREQVTDRINLNILFAKLKFIKTVTILSIKALVNKEQNFKMIIATF